MRCRRRAASAWRATRGPPWSGRLDAEAPRPNWQLGVALDGFETWRGDRILGSADLVPVNMPEHETK